MYIPETFKTYGLIIAIVIASFWFAYKFVPPPPPSKITIAAGNASSTYYAMAQEYRSFLKDNGIETEILETAGSMENIDLLLSGKADIGFVQSGLSDTQNKQSLLALGSLFYEPVWVFTSSPLTGEKDIQALEGTRIAIGYKGSGTNALAQQLLELNGINDKDMYSHIGGTEAVDALTSKDIDALFIVSTTYSQTVRQLLETPDVYLMNFERAQGYSSTLPFISDVTLHEGAIDIGNNVPSEDIHLLSPVAQLISHKDFNGAIKSLLVRASAQIHDKADTFSAKGDFPTSKYVDFPLAEEAENYYKYGPSFFQRLLPFWLADTLNRMVVLIIPLLGIMIPLLKIASPTYRWRIRSKIYRWYKNLKRIEASEKNDIDDINKALDTLEQIDHDVRNTKIPLAYTDELYNLRMHIRMIRDQLIRARKPEPDPKS